MSWDNEVSISYEASFRCSISNNDPQLTAHEALLRLEEELGRVPDNTRILVKRRDGVEWIYEAGQVRLPDFSIKLEAR